MGKKYIVIFEDMLVDPIVLHLEEQQVNRLNCMDDEDVINDFVVDCYGYKSYEVYEIENLEHVGLK